MWFVSVLSMTAVAAVSQTAPSTALQLPPTVHSRSQAFAIPFTVNQSAQRPTSVQLFVSDNQGASWKPHAKVPAATGKFKFFAQSDGEYWFFVTADERATPAGTTPRHPQMRVAVDTQAPTLGLEAVSDEGGVVVLRWSASDAQLNPHTLRIEYQQDGDGETWRKVAIQPAADISPTQPRGIERIVPQGAGRRITIRAEIKDAAGNRSLSHRTVNLDKHQLTGGPAPIGPAPIGVGPVTGREPMTSLPAAPTVTDPATVHRGSPGGASRWPAENSADLPAAREPTVGGRVAPPPTRDMTTVEPPWTRNPAASAFGPPPLPDRPRPADPAFDTPTQQPAASLGSAQARDPMLPPGAKLLMINSRAFDLPYSMDGVAGQISLVELWVTVDGGRTWSLQAVDADRRSPLEVTVPGDGIYGFRLVVGQASGAIDSRPLPGEAPQRWVGVDEAPPEGRISTVQPHRPGQPGLATIYWQCEDWRPASTGVQLSFSAQPTGPWTEIAAALPFRGSHVWQTERPVPQLVYLRLTMLDEAGNRGSYVIPQPVQLLQTAAAGANPPGGSAFR